ncbi:hypothetical protein [Anaerolentibacter hominis]|uniref:hypothetical protein n=1 Tax=Anaerolentibacter hominis TaxID=3079009 RepID=UPI0031B82D45
MDYSSYLPIYGLVQSISPYNDCCSIQVLLQTDNGPITIIVSPETYVVDSVRLVPGLYIFAFFDAHMPVPLIYPPQYQAIITGTLNREEQVMIGYFDQTLTASDASLKLNLPSSVDIVTTNGQSFACDPGDHDLIVYYGAATKSIPPQTTPSKIIVLC